MVDIQLLLHDQGIFFMLQHNMQKKKVLDSMPMIFISLNQAIH
jgi:hypothetical protein